MRQVIFHIISERRILFFETNSALATAHFKNEESGCQLQCLVREAIYDVNELTASKTSKCVSENTCLRCQAVRESLLIRVGGLAGCQWWIALAFLWKLLKPNHSIVGILSRVFAFLFFSFIFLALNQVVFKYCTKTNPYMLIKLGSRHRSIF